MQICPDCQAKWPDDANYCSHCRAKLPNANERMPDYKKNHDSLKIDSEELLNSIKVSLDNDSFGKYLLMNILKRAMDGIKSSSLEEEYLGIEILKILLKEVKWYSELKSKAEIEVRGELSRPL